jgi:hypothetical protein
MDSPIEQYNISCFRSQYAELTGSTILNVKVEVGIENPR